MTRKKPAFNAAAQTQISSGRALLTQIMRKEPDMALVQACIKAGAAPDVKKMKGKSFLTMAILRGHPKIAEALLASGVSAVAEDQARNVPLIFAARHAQVTILKMLMAHGAADGEDGKYNVRSALRIVVPHGYLGSTEALLDKRPDLLNAKDFDGNTWLLLAIRHQQVAVADLLLDRGADVTILNGQGESVLAWAQRHKNKETRDILQNVIETGIARRIAREQQARENFDAHLRAGMPLGEPVELPKQLRPRRKRMSP